MTNDTTIVSLAKSAEYSEEIKKSRFIARAAPVESIEEALAFLQKVREPAATHNCWAYKIGGEYRFSDDGEPGGTAGRPILGAMERQGVDRVMVVVTRYFGGIKLGAGGLARAYGGVAASCIRLAKKRRIVPTITVSLHLGFEHVGILHQLVEKYAASDVHETYTDKGLEATLGIARSDFQNFRASAADATGGQAVVESTGDITSDE